MEGNNMPTWSSLTHSYLDWLNYWCRSDTDKPTPKDECYRRNVYATEIMNIPSIFD